MLRSVPDTRIYITRLETVSTNLPTVAAWAIFVHSFVVVLGAAPQKKI
jgi:hypothetical protein